MYKNEDGVPLVSEGEAGICMHVQSWSQCHRVAVGRGPEGWGVLDEELSDREWELPSHVPPIRFANSKGFKPAPRRRLNPHISRG